jgi:hypothetical protein
MRGYIEDVPVELEESALTLETAGEALPPLGGRGSKAKPAYNFG